MTLPFLRREEVHRMTFLIENDNTPRPLDIMPPPITNQVLREGETEISWALLYSIAKSQRSERLLALRQFRCLFTPSARIRDFGQMRERGRGVNLQADHHENKPPLQAHLAREIQPLRKLHSRPPGHGARLPRRFPNQRRSR